MEPPVKTADPLVEVTQLLERAGQLDQIQPQTEAQNQMAQAEQYDADVTFIGAGPGGYVGAIRAAQLGGRVVCIEKEYLGGCCLNWGCIPTKTMIAAVERYQQVKHADAFGITTGEVSIDFAKLMAHKDKVVSTLRNGIASLFKKNGVRHIQGTGRIAGHHRVEVVYPDGSTETIRTRAIVIATGSAPVKLPVPGLEGEGIWTSDDAVSAKEVPPRMLIIGAGAIGCEFGYIFNGLGSKVTIVEIMPQILPNEDADIAAELQRSLTRQGIRFLLNSRVTEVKHGKDDIKQVVVQTEKGEEVVECEVVLVGVGRRAVLDGLGLETVNIKTHEKGIAVNDKMETSVPDIYAIGDVTGRIQLAHVASMEGIVAASNAMGHPRRMNYRAVPSCVYTVPEVASVGLTEQQAREQGYDVRVGKYAFRGLGKAMAMGEREGLVKVVAEARYGEILGVHIVGPHATDLIGEPVTAIQLESTIEEMVQTIHAHPTLTEAILEACEDTERMAIHK
jgi:dihydrolipoamide dehydrogenase